MKIIKKGKTSVASVVLDLIWAKNKNKKCSVTVYSRSPQNLKKPPMTVDGFFVWFSVTVCNITITTNRVAISLSSQGRNNKMVLK
ncbi:hypothetical protein ACM55G_01455 [Flavobacterium sp. LB3P122]